MFYAPKSPDAVGMEQEPVGVFGKGHFYLAPSEAGRVVGDSQNNLGWGNTLGIAQR